MRNAKEPTSEVRITCIDYMLKAHEAFESGLGGDAVRYQNLRGQLDTRSRAWLDHLIETRGLEQHFRKLDAIAATSPAPPLIDAKGCPAL